MSSLVQPAHYSLTFDEARSTLTLEGDWVISRASSFRKQLQDHAAKCKGNMALDASHLRQLDTAGALIISQFVQDVQKKGYDVQFQGFSDQAIELMQLIHAEDFTFRQEKKKRWTINPLALFGQKMVMLGRDAYDVTSFMGAYLSSLAAIVPQPSQWRLNALVTHMDKAGFRAVPIIVLMNFIIGVIVAQQSAFQLRNFGAEIFAVDLIGILVFREIGVLIASILIAGRTGSSFTAELGSMKMREEIDAMRVIGLNPMRVLVVPRILALMLILPLLTFIANIAATLGAMLILWVYSGIQPATFIDRFQDAVWLETVMVGFIKAPFMALVIGLIACVQGLRVKGSAESLGEEVTASVVKSIFMVIVLDGIFAIFFAAIDY
jgi:phospholipid/cholesterol/gamma-HCH transport system permease protein